MQRGFTDNTSSINTGLLLTEYKNESKEKKHLFLLSLMLLKKYSDFDGGKKNNLIQSF
jgi:hypothetical protein